MIQITTNLKFHTRQKLDSSFMSLPESRNSKQTDKQCLIEFSLICSDLTELYLASSNAVVENI